MTELLLAAITLAAIAVIVYHHAVYPVLLGWLAGRKAGRADDRPQQGKTIGDLPTIALLIPAYNEAEHIADKIRNIGALSYPSQNLQVNILCDGCSDNTAQLARQVAREPECQHLELTITEFTRNRGKVAVLNEAIGECDTEIIALSDVSALVSIDALLRLAEQFAQPEVGIVSSNYRLLNPGSEGEAVYWVYQRRLKQKEAAVAGLIGAHGAFYAFRRALFRPLEPDTINDDFILPMRIVSNGHLGIYSPDINSIELEKASQQTDSHRRRRIAAGNVQQALRLRGLLAPRFGGLAFAFGSSKVLRVTMPWMMLTAFVGSIALSPSSPFFALLTAMQLLLYSIAVGNLVSDTSFGGRVGRALAYLVNGHFATLAGTVEYAQGHWRQGWQRSNSPLQPTGHQFDE
jgi:cellulose synthase/poly-beta-1,6-N-acetylglucosamine synthase-like glycosyltransferase